MFLCAISWFDQLWVVFVWYHYFKALIVHIVHYITIILYDHFVTEVEPHQYQIYNVNWNLITIIVLI